jgi:hypothetical protein
MTEEMVQVSLEGLVRIQSAAKAFARAEIIRIAEVVVADLRCRRIVGFFDDVAARHMWDEYCWELQQGPGNWADTLRALISGEVEKLPKHALIFLSLYAFEEDADSDEQELLGTIWLDGIVNTVADEIDRRARQRNLDLIGPHRGDLIGYEIEGFGMVWSALSERGEATDLIAGHVDTTLTPTPIFRCWPTNWSRPSFSLPMRMLKVALSNSSSGLGAT